MTDPYWRIIRQQWDNIHMLYMQFEEKKPVMLFDVQEQRIYAYPYAEFKADLSPKSQISLAEQYEDAIASGKMVVFVRDNKKKKFVSYSVEI